LPCFVNNGLINTESGHPIEVRCKLIKERVDSSNDYKTYQINLGVIILGTISISKKEEPTMIVFGQDNQLDYDSSLTNIAKMLKAQAY